MSSDTAPDTGTGQFRKIASYNSGTPSGRNLRNSSQQFQVSMEMSPLPFLTVDYDGTIQRLNRACSAYLGYEARQLIDRPLGEFASPDCADAFNAAWQEQIQAGFIRGLLTEFVHEEGYPLWTELNGHPVQQQSDQPPNLMLNLQDLLPEMGDTQSQDEAISPSSCLQMAGSFAIAINRQGKIVNINRHGLRLLGFTSPQQLIGEDWFDRCLPESTRDDLRESFQHVLQSSTPPEQDCRLELLTQHGKPCIVKLQCRLIQMNSQTNLGIMGIGLDITDQARAEAELAASQRDMEITNTLTQTFLHSEDDHTFSEVLTIVTKAFDAGMGMILWRCPFEDQKWLGYSARSLSLDDTSCEIDDRLLTFSQASLEQQPWHAVMQQQPVAITDDTLALGLPELQLSHVLAVPIAHSQELIGLLMVRGAESWPQPASLERLERYACQIAPMLHARLKQVQHDRQRKELETQLLYSQKMEAIGELAGGIAHDFNNLLQIIIGNVQLAKGKLNTPTECRAKLDQIGDASERAATLVRRLLAYSRRQILRLESTDLNHVISGITDMLQRVIGEQIQLRFEPTSHPLPVQVDTDQIEQVIMNLCINARDAMPEGGKIELQTSVVNAAEIEQDNHDHQDIQTDRNYVRLLVRDTGCGMGRHVRAHAFEPFFTTKEFGNSSGLGLSVVHGILHQHAGTISVSSVLGKGTDMIIHLPLLEQTIAPTTKHRSASARPTVLVVEDDLAVRKLAIEILAADYQILEAIDGEEALEVFQQHQQEIDLVLMDVVLPKLGGKEAARELLDQRPDLPLIYTSGYSQRHLREELMNHPRREFLQKPYLASDLLAMISRLIASAR